MHIKIEFGKFQPLKTPGHVWHILLSRLASVRWLFLFQLLETPLNVQP